MDRKWPNFDFQPQNSMSNTDLIHLKIIFNSEYWISRTIFISAMIWLIHLGKTLFSKKGPYFCRIMHNPKQYPWKNICWHQLFRQKWAFSRLSTTMLHKHGAFHSWNHCSERHDSKCNFEYKVQEIRQNLRRLYLWTLDPCRYALWFDLINFYHKFYNFHTCGQVVFTNKVQRLILQWQKYLWKKREDADETHYLTTSLCTEVQGITL